MYSVPLYYFCILCFIAIHIYDVLQRYYSDTPNYSNEFQNAWAGALNDWDLAWSWYHDVDTNNKNLPHQYSSVSSNSPLSSFMITGILLEPDKGHAVQDDMATFSIKSMRHTFEAGGKGKAFIWSLQSLSATILWSLTTCQWYTSSGLWKHFGRNGRKLSTVNRRHRRRLWIQRKQT